MHKYRKDKKYKVRRKHGSRGKKTAVKVLAGFFSVMAVCTVLSRAASSVLVAQVEVETPVSGTVSSSYEGSGTVIPSEKEQIFVWRDQQVETSAAVGTALKSGECIVQFRMEYLDEKIGKKQSEIAQLDLQLKQQELAAAAAEEDENAKKTAELSAQQIRLQIDEAYKELTKLQEYQAQDGQICAREDCVILENPLTAGTLTTGTEVIVIGSGAWKLQGNIDAGDQDVLAEGMNVEVTLDHAAKSENVELQSVGESRGAGAGQTSGAETGAAEEAGGSKAYVWQAAVPEGMEVSWGTGFTWKAQVSSEKVYECKIPLMALREDARGSYCLVVSEESTMLGTVKTARKVPLTVLKKDSEEAAVDAALEKTDQIIVSSEKYVEAGDQVRIKE